MKIPHQILYPAMFIAATIMLTETWLAIQELHYRHFVRNRKGK